MTGDSVVLDISGDGSGPSAVVGSARGTHADLQQDRLADDRFSLGFKVHEDRGVDIRFPRLIINLSYGACLFNQIPPLESPGLTGCLKLDTSGSEFAELIGAQFTADRTRCEFADCSPSIRGIELRLEYQCSRGQKLGVSRPTSADPEHQRKNADDAQYE